MSDKPLTVWVVDDDQSVRWVLEQALHQAGMQTQTFERAEHLLEAIETDSPDVLITDVRMPGMSGLALLDRLHTQHPDLPIIVITAHSDLESAVAAYKGGAFEYLPKPFDLDEAVELVHKAARQNGGPEHDVAAAPQTIASIIGQAPAMQEVFRSIGRLAGSSMTVLITGESGTGKELVAQALHQHSPRADKSFVALNTSAIASELLESELFGHERGSFTGADARRIGRFEQADGGTLFLDEIGDMSPALQTRLLRVLAESEFYRVGGQTSIKVDVRVIAATNQDLARAVKESRFREDLYHRLNVIRINTPPLRQRREDIPLLLNHYLAEAANELTTAAKSIDAEALEALQAYDWPGNVRQLVNTSRRLTVTAPGRVISTQDIPAELGGVESTRKSTQEWTRSLAAWAETQLAASDSSALLDSALPQFEKTLIEIAMARANGSRKDAAKILGWGRNTLTRKMKSLHLD
jgi:two-component system nitrogen regulation response regulator GlnG